MRASLSVAGVNRLHAGDEAAFDSCLVMTTLLVVGAVVLVSFLAVVLVLEAARRRPLTPTDLYCAALDERLAAEAAEPAPRLPRTPEPEAAGRAWRRPGDGAQSPGVAV
jgi:hypothetical protein